MSTQTRPRIGDRIRVVRAELDILKSYVGRLGTVSEPKGIPNGAQDKIFVQLDKARKQKRIGLFLKPEDLTTDIDSPIPCDSTATEIQETLDWSERESSLSELREVEVGVLLNNCHGTERWEGNQGNSVDLTTNALIQDTSTPSQNLQQSTGSNTCKDSVQQTLPRLRELVEEQSTHSSNRMDTSSEKRSNCHSSCSTELSTLSSQAAITAEQTKSDRSCIEISGNISTEIFLMSGMSTTLMGTSKTTDMKTLNVFPRENIQDITKTVKERGSRESLLGGLIQEKSTRALASLRALSGFHQLALHPQSSEVESAVELNGSGSECLQCLTPSLELEGSLSQPRVLVEFKPLNSSKLTPSVGQSCLDIGMGSQFTRISEPSIQQVGTGMWQHVGFLVKTSAGPTLLDGDSTAIDLDSGEKCSGSSASPDHDLSLSKMSRLLDIEDLPILFTALPKAGMWDTTSLWQQPTLERPTFGKGYSLLPTPMSYSKGSGTRRPGQTKLDRKLRLSLDIKEDEVLSPAIPLWMMGFPSGWMGSTALVGGKHFQLPQNAESPAKPILDDTTNLSASATQSYQELQRSHCLESSTSTPCCENFPDRTEPEDEQLCENFPKLGKTWLDPHEIDLHAGTQSRDRTDWETVQRYTELMQEKLWDWERGPLPVIFQDRFGRKYPGDCHHRTEAAIKAEVDLICVDLRKGTLIDAIMHSCEAKANREHGLPLTAKDQRRRIELFLETRDQLPEGDERRRYSSREIARYLGLSESGYRTIVNIINEREMLGKISQFASGDRVQVVRSRIGSGGFWPEGTLGKVQELDKKKGILVVPDTAPHLDRWILSHGWIHPDNLIKSDAPWLSGKISQDEERERHESPGTDSGSALPSQPLVGEPKSRDKQLLPDVNRNGDVPPTAEKPAPAALVNQVAIANGKPDVVAAEIAIGIKHLNPEGLLHVIEAIAHHVGAEVLSNLLVESIYKNEVAGLCNKCLGAMDKRAFSWMEVEKINFTGLSDSALKLLVKESKRALNERYHPEYFNGRHCGSTQSRKSASSTSAPAICCGCGEDTDDEDLTLGVPGGDDEEAL